MRRHRGLVGLTAAALVVAVVTAADAEVTTEKSASILVFPKVIADGTRDTIIQITSTSNSMAHAHCFYVNGALTFPDLPPDPILNPPLWQEIDFDIWFTKQQPTHWVVSRGRLVNPADPPCDWRLGRYSCPDAGIDPGRIPPVVEDFTGELKCIEVDQAGAPISGNHLKGEATVITLNVCNLAADPIPGFGRCEVSGELCEPTVLPCLGVADSEKYNGIGVLGNENNDMDNVLCLGGEPSEECPSGAEYNACPQTWILNHYAEFAEDPLAGAGSEIHTYLTIVPCTENFETQDPTVLQLQLMTWNEFEQPFSSQVRVLCWADLNLQEINPMVFLRSTLNSDFAHTRIRASAGTQSGFMVVGQQSHTTADGWTGRAAFNLHIEGERPGPDIITIPPDQVGSGL